MSKDRRFPIERLQPCGDVFDFSGTLVLNPHLGPQLPTIRFGTALPLAPIDLGPKAPLPDIWGTTLDTTLFLGDVVLPERDWRRWDDVRGAEDDAGNSSVYVSQIHCPVVTHGFRLRRKSGRVFRADWDVELLLEGTGWKSARKSLHVDVEYQGITVVEFLDSDTAYPESWDLGLRDGRIDERALRSLCGRFVDLDGYALNVRETERMRSWSLEPVGS